ncbi:hypothetical protein RUM43_011460 [Polyplax serrata]|uniref:EGF-like domain-containing protein n=1 Tax=Polyplax serrata TaxID=468196 RepID=A0AAN8S3P2_POLSC
MPRFSVLWYLTTVVVISFACRQHLIFSSELGLFHPRRSEDEVVMAIGEHQIRRAFLLLSFFCVINLTDSARSKYVPKWKKQACEIPALQNEHSHYTCGDNGEVKCLPGWTGDVCDVPICRKGCDPLQGYCKRPGECRCKLGFYGELCNKCIPLPGCQHGYCNNSFECICEEGWDGLFCSEREYKHSYGVESIVQADVFLGAVWVGRVRLAGTVRYFQAVSTELAQNHWNVNATKDTPEYYARRVTICAENCHKEHGYCYKPGDCRCKVGWWGTNCEKCYPYPGCKHGTCNKPWQCNCQPGWGGVLCDEELNYCENNPGLCQNGGTCVSLTEDDGNFKCHCSEKFRGERCEEMKPEENNNGTDNGRPTMMTSKRPATSKAPMTTTMAASKMPTTTPTTTSTSTTTPARPTTVTAVTELLTSPASQGSKATSEEPVLQVTSTTESKDDKLNET